MFCDVRQIVIVKTGPPAGLGVEGEPKWFDEMQVGTCIRAQPDNVAGVRRIVNMMRNIPSGRQSDDACRRHKACLLDSN